MGAWSLCRLSLHSLICRQLMIVSLLELKGIGGCSVGNLFVACLELSMFVSVVIGIFLTGNLGD